MPVQIKEETGPLGVKKIAFKVDWAPIHEKYGADPFGAMVNSLKQITIRGESSGRSTDSTDSGKSKH